VAVQGSLRECCLALRGDHVRLPRVHHAANLSLQRRPSGASQFPQTNTHVGLLSTCRKTPGPRSRLLARQLNSVTACQVGKAPGRATAHTPSRSRATAPPHTPSHATAPQHEPPRASARATAPSANAPPRHHATAPQRGRRATRSWSRGGVHPEAPKPRSPVSRQGATAPPRAPPRLAVAQHRVLARTCRGGGGAGNSCRVSAGRGVFLSSAPRTTRTTRTSGEGHS